MQQNVWPEDSEINPPDYLSYSQVTTFLSCPKRYDFRYMKRVRSLKTLNLAYGSVIHGVLEIFHKNEFTPLSVLLDKLNDSWDEQLLDTTINPWENVNELRAQSFSVITQYIQWFDHPHPIKYVERKILKPVVNGFDLLGYIDLEDSHGLMVDLKTASKMWTQEKADAELQPDFYGYLNNYTNKFPFEYWVILKSDPPTFAKFRTWRDGEKSQKKVVELCSKLVDAIHARDFPADTKNGGYGCKWCDYNRMCDDTTVKR